MFYEDVLSTNAHDFDDIYDIILYLRNKKRVACDYRVITAREMRVKHDAINQVFYMHLECRYNSIITQRLNFLFLL